MTTPERGPVTEHDGSSNNGRRRTQARAVRRGCSAGAARGQWVANAA